MKIYLARMYKNVTRSSLILYGDYTWYREPSRMGPDDLLDSSWI